MAIREYTYRYMESTRSPVARKEQTDLVEDTETRSRSRLTKRCDIIERNALFYEFVTQFFSFRSDFVQIIIFVTTDYKSTAEFRRSLAISTTSAHFSRPMSGACMTVRQRAWLMQSSPLSITARVTNRWWGRLRYQFACHRLSHLPSPPYAHHIRSVPAARANTSMGRKSFPVPCDWTQRYQDIGTREYTMERCVWCKTSMQPDFKGNRSKYESVLGGVHDLLVVLMVMRRVACMYWDEPLQTLKTKALSLEPLHSSMRQGLPLEKFILDRKFAACLMTYIFVTAACLCLCLCMGCTRSECPENLSLCEE